MMSISVVTINLNQVEGLKRTVCSVRQQLKAVDEFVIVDGVSTDGSVEFLDALGAEALDFKLNVIVERDFGIFDAQNKGVRAATSEYIVVINSGDWLFPDALKLVRECLAETRDADVVVGSQLAFLPDFMPQHISVPTPDSIWPHGSTYIHRSVYENRGLYDLSFRWFSDAEFLFRIRKGAEVCYVNEVLSAYDLTGVSSIPSLKKSRELFRLYRCAGSNVTGAAYRAYFRPLTKAFLLSLGVGAVVAWVRLRFREYREIPSSVREVWERLVNSCSGNQS